MAKQRGYPDQRGLWAESDSIAEQFVPSESYKAQQKAMAQTLLAAGLTPEQVAATLATYLRASRIVQLNGTSITIPNAGLVIGRVVADQQTQTETRRQQQGIRLSCWCPTPTIRDQTAILIDAGLSQQTFLTLPDGTTARLCETGTRVFDQSQNANLYRRDLLLSAEYATTITTPLPAMIFGNSLISPNGVTTRSRIG